MAVTDVNIKIYEAVLNSNLTELENIFEENNDLNLFNVVYENGNNILHIAARYESNKILSILINNIKELNSCINELNNDQKTPLDILLEQKISSKDSEYFLMLKIFLENGSYINADKIKFIVNKLIKDSPRDYFAGSSQLEYLSPNNPQQESIIERLREGNKIRAIVMISNGYNINNEEKIYNLSPLDYFLEKYDYENIQFLLEQNADLPKEKLGMFLRDVTLCNIIKKVLNLDHSDLSVNELRNFLNQHLKNSFKSLREKYGNQYYNYNFFDKGKFCSDFGKVNRPKSETYSDEERKMIKDLLIANPDEFMKQSEIQIMEDKHSDPFRQELNLEYHEKLLDDVNKKFRIHISPDQLNKILSFFHLESDLFKKNKLEQSNYYSR